jgi:hypothetical protein
MLQAVTCSFEVSDSYLTKILRGHKPSVLVTTVDITDLPNNEQLTAQQNETDRPKN